MADPKPLSATEEKNLREYVGKPGYEEFLARQVPRILATLDAARASRPEPGADLAGLLRTLVEHFVAMHGYTAHRLGCECGGTNDGVHSCRSFLAAWNKARRALAALPASPEPKEPTDG